MTTTIPAVCIATLKELIKNKLIPHQLGVATGVILKNLINQKAGKRTDDTIRILGILTENKLRTFSSEYLDALRLVYIKKQEKKRIIALENAKEILNMSRLNSDLSTAERLINKINFSSVNKIGSVFLKIKYKMYLNKLLFSLNPVLGISKISEIYQREIKMYSPYPGKLSIYFDYYLLTYFTSNKLFVKIQNEIDSLVNTLSRDKNNIATINLFKSLQGIVTSIDKLRKSNIKGIEKLFKEISESRPHIDIAHIATFGEYASIVRIDTLYLFGKLFKYIKDHADKFSYSKLADSYFSTLQAYLLIYDDAIIRILSTVSSLVGQDLASVSSPPGKKDCEKIVTQLILDVISGKYKSIVPEEIRAILETDYNFVANGYYHKTLEVIDKLRETYKVNLSTVEELAQIQILEHPETEFTIEEKIEPEITHIEQREEPTVEEETTAESSEKEESLTLLDELVLEESDYINVVPEKNNDEKKVLHPESEKSEMLYGYTIKKTLKDESHVKTFLVSKKEGNFILKQFLSDIMSSELKDIFNRIVKHWQTVNGVSALRLTEAVFESKDKIYFVREYTERTLKDIISEGFESLDNILDTFIEIIKSLETFYRNTSHAHGNLKPANILIKGNTYLFSDFGQVELKKLLNQDIPLQDIRYMAPEQLTQQDTSSTFATDIWQLGIILYEMITGRNPFEKYATTGELIHAINSGTLTQNNQIPSELMKLIKEMCSTSIKMRPSLKEIIERLYLI